MDRVGLCFPPISIGCYDIYGNRMPFASVPEVRMKIISGGGVLADVTKMKFDLSVDRRTLKITVCILGYLIVIPYQIHHIHIFFVALVPLLSFLISAGCIG